MNDNQSSRTAKDDEESDLRIRMGYRGVGSNRQLVVDFGEKVSFLAFDKTTGLAFAEAFMKRLSEL